MGGELEIFQEINIFLSFQEPQVGDNFCMYNEN